MLLEFLTSKFFFVIPMVAGSALFWAITRFMSLGTGITRREANEGIKNGNTAMAVYFGFRIIGVAVAVAGCVIAGASI